MHDATVFNNSHIAEKLEAICYKVPRDGDPLPHLRGFKIFGDAAYGILPWFLTPFRDTGHLTRTQKRYNSLFSSTRRLIENAFALLKQRFRQLLLLEFHSIDKMSKFILSVCVLHNLAIDAQDTEPFGDEEEEAEVVPEQTPFVCNNNLTARQLKQRGEDVRNYLADYLYNLH